MSTTLPRLFARFAACVLLASLRFLDPRFSRCPVHDLSHQTHTLVQSSADISSQSHKCRWNDMYIHLGCTLPSPRILRFTKSSRENLVTSHICSFTAAVQAMTWSKWLGQNCNVATEKKNFACFAKTREPRWKNKEAPSRVSTGATKIQNVVIWEPSIAALGGHGHGLSHPHLCFSSGGSVSVDAVDDWTCLWSTMFSLDWLSLGLATDQGLALPPKHDSQIQCKRMYI